MSMRPSRKLRNLNVWQQGIAQHRALQHRGAASSHGSSAPGGWAKAFFRRLLGRRAAAAKGGEPSLSASSRPAAENLALAISQYADRPELREAMLSRRALTMPGQGASPPRMVQAGAIDVSLCRDLRFWRRGKEFVAAALGGFDPGAGAEHAAQRRAFWRQRSQRRTAVVSPSPTSKAAQSLRSLLRALAAGQGRDEVSHDEVGRDDVNQIAVGTPAGTVSIGGRSRKTANRKVPQPVAAAAGMRRAKSFRDHKFRQQGLGLLQKALRAKKSGGPSHGPQQMYRPAAGWVPGAISKSVSKPTDSKDSSSGPSSKQG